MLPAADGSRLVMRVEMELHGLLKLAGPLLRRREQPMFQRDLADIKARLEETHAASRTGTGEEWHAADETSRGRVPGGQAGRGHRGVKKPQGHGSNVVYQRLRQRGYKVFAVNPNAGQVEGGPCYHDLKSIPGGVDWVVIGTGPETAEATMRECADLGITRVWMHRGPGPGSVSHPAAEYGRRHGITMIEGGCPCMFGPTADPGHKVMRVMLTLTGNVPRRV